MTRSKQDAPRRADVKHIAVVSDLHFGSALAAMPREGFVTDDELTIMPSPLQRVLWDEWEGFWGWVEDRVGGDDFAVVVNGDAVDGRVKDSPQSLPLIEDQIKLAACCLSVPTIRRASKVFFVRGTEAHVGKCAEREEALADKLRKEVALGRAGRHGSTYDLRVLLGDNLIQFSHHIGSTSSPVSETTTLMRELVKASVRAGRWGGQMPRMMVRSHRHTHVAISWPTRSGYCTGITTPGWQALTSYGHKVVPAEIVQIGGVLISLQDDGDIDFDARWATLPEPSPVRL